MIAGRRLIGAAKALVPTRFRPKLRHVAERHGFVEPLPAPFRYPFRELVRAGSPYYPNYLWGTLCAAAVAATLGYDRISVIEFGVAGGNGLVALYSSTMDAFRIFEGLCDLVMPRVVCYFDDIAGFSHSDFTGERLAISDFNERQELRKISQIYGLRYVMDLEQWWTDQMYMAHFFDHPLYNEFDGSNRIRELPLGGG